MSSILQDIEITSLEADINLIQDDLNVLKKYVYSDTNNRIQDFENHIAALKSHLDFIDTEHHERIINIENHINDIYNVICEIPMLITEVLAYICSPDLHNECCKQHLLESLRTYAINAQTILNQLRYESAYRNHNNY